MVAPGMPQNPSVKRWLGDIEPPDRRKRLVAA
jgi:hypothetical protein